MTPSNLAARAKNNYRHAGASNRFRRICLAVSTREEITPASAPIEPVPLISPEGTTIMTEDGTKARGIIAVCITLLLAGALLGSFIVKPDAVQQGNINLLIGALITSLATIVGFYFGSSSGSKVLAATQAEVIKQAVAATSAAPTGKPDDPVSVTETPQK